MDSPRQTVHLHLPFLSLTTKLLWSCPTTASLGFTVTIIWEKKKKKSLYDLLFETANEKSAEKEGKETCMCSEMISSHTMVSKPVPNFCLISLVASILFTI